MFDKGEKRTIIITLLFSVFVAIAEVFTAATAMMLGQILHQPLSAEYYLRFFKKDILSNDEIIIYSTAIFAFTYFFKIILTTMDSYFQINCINKLSFRFKLKFMLHLSNRDYTALTSENTTYTIKI